MKLLESIDVAKSRLDKEKGVVRDVKILGFKSAHGYKYSKRAMLEAVPMYQDVAVYVNHPNRNNLRGSRAYEDRFGRLKNVRFQEGRGLVGDMHYNRKHRIAEQFEYDVENDPLNVGLSHNASGSTARVKGETIVESIDVLRSVDLVAEPATNVGLFESKGARMRVRRKKSAGRSGQTAKQLLESIAANQPRRRKRSPMMQLIEGVFKKEKDPKRLKTRINKILDANNSDNDLVEDAPRRRTGTNKRDLMEARLQKEINALKHERRVRDLCEDKGLRPTAVQMKALLGMNSKKEVKELIESMKTRGNPRGGARSREGGEGHVKDVRTKDFLEDLGVLDLEEDDSED